MGGGGGGWSMMLFQDLLMNKKLWKVFIQIEIISNNISLYYCFFYQCNTSLLNTSINLF